MTTNNELNNFNKAITSIDIYSTSDNISNKLYNSIGSGFTNYNEDMIYIYNVNRQLNQTIIDLSSNNTSVSDQLNSLEYIKKKYLQTNTYYIKKYYKQIGILKEIVFFCCLGLLGFILYTKGIFSERLLILYISFLLSILFIKVLYDLWDIYIRDEKMFDEYDFSIYGKGVPDPNKKPDFVPLDSSSSKSDNLSKC
jgi:hypothetical protein